MEKKIKNINQELLASLSSKDIGDEYNLEEIEELIVDNDSCYFDANFSLTKSLDNWLHSSSNFDVIQDEDDTYIVDDIEGTIIITIDKPLLKYKKR